LTITADSEFKDFSNDLQWLGARLIGKSESPSDWSAAT
jgi:hypothetical protein